MRRLRGLILAAMPALAMAQAPATPPAVSPYAGQQTRPIKALSEAEVEDYRKGAGMGFAKTAELNRYPGPKHVLELAEPLKLADRQRQRTLAIHDRMQRDAVSIGERVVQSEAALDSLFTQRKASAAAIEKLTRELGELQGRLRFVHLRAHAEMAEVLTPEQIELYQTLRGYDDTSTKPGGPHGDHAH